MAGTAEDPALYDSETTAKLNSLRLQVNPGNILQVRNAIYREAMWLRAEFVRVGFQNRVSELGQDPVSKVAAEAFNARIQSLSDQCQEFLRTHEEVVDGLDRTARSYGYTDSQISESFNRFLAADSGRTGS